MLPTSRCRGAAAWLQVGLLAWGTASCSDAIESTGGEPPSAEGGAGGGVGGAGGADLPRPDPTSVRATSSLAEGRSHHTATLLPDGRVVVLGGETAGREPLASAEVFDPSTETWSGLPPLPEPRANHTTTLLGDGTLLVVGGARSNQNGSPSPDGALETALVYDPAVGVIAEAAMAGPRAGHHALPLPGGGVLVVGGSGDEVGSACTSVPSCFYGKALATAERFDPGTRTFSATGPLAGSRMLFGAVVLPSGTPLLVGGANDFASLKRVEAFDAWSGAFSQLAPLANARLRPVVALLGTGVVLAAAGKVANVGPVGVTELFDPATGAWTAGPDIGAPRTGSEAVTLESGNALVVGGFNQITGDTLDELLIFDASTHAWTALPPLGEPRALATVTLLQDGRVLIAGGTGALASAEIAE